MKVFYNGCNYIAYVQSYNVFLNISTCILFRRQLNLSILYNRNKEWKLNEFAVLNHYRKLFSSVVWRTLINTGKIKMFDLDFGSTFHRVWHRNFISWEYGLRKLWLHNNIYKTYAAPKWHKISCANFVYLVPRSCLP